MKLKKIIGIHLLFLSVQSIFSQGFVNLDFELANLTSIPAGQFGGYVSSTNAIPNWTAFIDGNQTTQVLQNNLTVGAPSIEILGPDWNLGGIIQSNYTVVLTAGVGGHTVTMSQTGLIPNSASSLLFVANSGNPGGFTFQVLFAGQSLNFSALSTGSNYTLYGADISPYSGLTGALSFSVSSIGSSFAYTYLDAIQFSNTAVPEPSELTLAALGTLLLGCRRWRRD